MIDLFGNSESTNNSKDVMDVFSRDENKVLKDLYLGYISDKEVLVEASDNLTLNDIVLGVASLLDNLEVEQKDYIINKLDVLKGLPRNALVSTTIADTLLYD